MTKAIDCKLGRVADVAEWWYDFTQAVEAMELGSWVESQEAIYQDEIQDNTLDYRRIANAFRSRARRKKGGTEPSIVDKGSFLAFYEQSPDDEGSQDSGSATGSKRKCPTEPSSQAKKRSQSCSACHGPRDRLAKCYYVFPEEAPSDFVFDEKLRKKVQTRINSDKELQREIEALKRQRNKNKGSH